MMNQIKWFFMSKYKKLLYQIKCAETNEQNLILQNGVVLEFSQRTAALDKLYETISRAGYSSYARTLISEKWHENNNKRIQGLEAEIERLERIIKSLDYKNIEIGVIKKFENRLKEEAYPFPCAIGVEYAVSLRQISDIVTEMIESHDE